MISTAATLILGSLSLQSGPKHPSPTPKPSRSRSQGLEAPSGVSFLVDKAFIAPKPAIVVGAIDFSEPPANITSASPLLINLAANPILCVPVAQAVVMDILGPPIPNIMDKCPASIFITDEGTKTTKKEEKIFTIEDLNKMLVDGNKVKQQKIDLMKESEVTDEAYNLMPRKEFINAQNRAAERSSQPTTKPIQSTALDPDDVTYNPFDSEEVQHRIENDFDKFVAESKACLLYTSPSPRDS